MLSRVARSFLRPVRNARSYHGPGYKPGTYNDLPVPQGSWKAQYDAKQSTYNMELAAGIILFTVTTGVVIANDWLDHSVWFAPKKA